MHFFNNLSIGQLSTNNRLVVPPMASQTADELGFVTEKTLEHYKRLASSRAGLVFVEYTYVHLSGRSEPNQLAADNEDKLAGLNKLASTIKENGSLAGLQITHAGGKGARGISDGTLLSPSGIKVPTFKGELEKPDILLLEGIPKFIDSFVRAARLASQAGFDLVELHCAHGYGLNQWLSSITNQREDEYGGSLEKRARLLFEIVERIKKEVPEIEIAARVPGQDMLEGGLSYQDMQWVVAQLEKRGLALIDVSNGLGGWQRPKHRRGQGYLFEDALAIKQSTKLPIIGVGGVHEVEFIEKSLKQGLVDLVAVGRSILEGAEKWGKFIGANK